MRRNFLYVFVATVVVSIVLMGGRKMLAQSSLPPQMITQAVDESQLVTLHGNVHPMAQAKYDQGEASSTRQMNHMLLLLKRSPEQQTALESLLAQQADKNSPNYGKYLTPAQFGEQFGASEQDISTISAWLSSHGFQVHGAGNGRNAIDFSGSVGEVQEAFHTEIHHFLINGQDHYANVSDPQVPAAFASIVAGVNSLNDFRPKPNIHKLGTFQMTLPSRKISRVSPEYTFPNTGCYGTNTACYGVGAYDFATIYNLVPLWTSGNNGSGETIAIVSDSDVYTADYSQFRSLMGLSPETVNRVIPTGVTNPGIQGPTCAVNQDEEEAIADVEWAGATAPGAAIDLVIAPSSQNCGTGTANAQYPFGGDYAAYYEINLTATPDPILSDSYGLCELDLGSSGNQLYNTLWSQASAEGITVVTATGDNGAAGCDNPFGSTPAEEGLQVNGVASTPYDVAVGGTDFDYINNPNTYWSSTNNTSQSSSANGPIPEMAYNDSCTSATVYKNLGSFSTASAACASAAADGNNADDVLFIVPIGGSGGASACTTPTNNGILPADCAGGYAKPTWQTGPGVPSDGHRDIPDLSLFSGDGGLFASETFYIVCEEDQTTPFPCGLTPQTSGSSQVFPFVAGGGTSIATQAMAGIVALIDQAHQKQYGSVAFNTQLYSLAASSGQTSLTCNASSSTAVNSSCDFRDITVGTNSMPCVTGTTNCGTTIGSELAPIGLPGTRFHWTPLSAGIVVCVIATALLLVILPGGRQRLRPALALLVFGMVLGIASCGGGGSNGTVSGGGGSSSGIGVLSGYNATTGYDRATGLGSINANALVNASGW